MIETTEAVNDEGIRFLGKIRFCEPYDYENGVRVEKVTRRFLEQSPELSHILRTLGLRKVGFDFCYDANVYAHYPMGYVQYKVTHHLFTGYWWLVRFLYNNARIFQQIPPAECFSWRYFAPYVWIKKLGNKWNKRK